MIAVWEPKETKEERCAFDSFLKTPLSQISRHSVP